MSRIFKQKAKKPAWKCSCGCIVPKKNAVLSGGQQYKQGYHVHCKLRKNHSPAHRPPRNPIEAQKKMVAQKKDPKLPSFGTISTTERIDVTNLPPRQRRKLFIDYMNQNGFKGFIKNDINRQTYFVFWYEKISE